MKKWTSILIAAGTLGCGAAYEGPVDARFDGSEFRRTQGVPERGFGTFLSWVTNRQQVGGPDWVVIPPASAPPKRSEALRVQFVNHATVLVQLDNVNILTDPIWAERASPVSFAGPARHKARGIAFGSLPKIDAVVISHNHYDHMDVETLLRLQERDQPLILVGLGNQNYLEDFGVTAKDTDWWQTHNVGGLTITFTPVQHWTARGMFDRGKSLWGGYFIQGRSGSVYFGGDTGYGPHFVETRKK